MAWYDKVIEENSKTPKPSDAVKEYIQDVIGAVEANNFEQLELWDRSSKEGAVWKTTNYGYGVHIGDFHGRQIFISITTSVIDDHKILFYYPTSELVDWGMIEKWLKQNLPNTAFDKNGRLNKVDASGFYNIFSLKGTHHETH